MSKDLPFEKDWRRTILQQQHVPAPGDWDKMAVLLEQEEVQPPLPLLLPKGWYYSLGAGLLLGLLSLRLLLPAPDAAGGHSNPLPRPAEASKPLPLPPGPVPVPEVNDTPPPPGKSLAPPPKTDGLSLPLTIAAADRSQQPDSAASPSDLPELRFPGAAWDSLDPATYASGLMACSRLHRDIRPLPLPEDALPDAPALPTRKTRRTHLGLLAGATHRPADAPWLLPLAGIALQQEWRPNWHIVTGVQIQRHPATRYFASQAGAFSMGGQADQWSQGHMYIVECPLLLGVQRGRWQLMGGMKFSRAFVRPSYRDRPEVTNSSTMSNGDLSPRPAAVAIAASIGAAVRIQPGLSLDLRYSQGTQPLVGPSPNGRFGAIPHQDWALSLVWWWR